MSLSALSHLLRWWCESLVDALLRPVYNRWQAIPPGTRRATLYSARFTALVYATPCYPCRVGWGGGTAGLFISSAPHESDLWEDEA